MRESRQVVGGVAWYSATGRKIAELDPRWEWVQTRRLGDLECRYMKGRCKHLEVVPVESLDGEVVAHLCLTCDTQLP